MSIKEYLLLFRRFWILLVVAVLIGGVAGLALSTISTTRYTASASVYFSLSFGNSANDLNQGSTYTQSQMQSFAILAVAPVVLDRVISELDLPTTSRTLARSISVTTPQDTVVLQIAASSRSAEQAADIANAVARYLDDEVQENAPRDASGESTVSTRLITPALAPQEASSPNTRLNVIAGLLTGLIVGLIIVLLRQTLDSRIPDADALSRLTPAPLLGSVPRSPMLSRGNLVMLHEPTSTIAESFRQLRANLQFASLDSDGLTVMVTSSMPGEGKSVTSCNLALATAESEMTVVLVDLDLRRPQIAHYFGVEESVGLSTVLLGRASIDDVIQPGGYPNLDVIAAGIVPPNPAVILASSALVALLDGLKKRYDVVVIDSAPVLAAADAPSLARNVDGVLVVVDTTVTRRQQLQHALGNLTAAGAQIFGIVLNKRKLTQVSYDSYLADTPRSRSVGSRITSRFKASRRRNASADGS